MTVSEFNEKINNAAKECSDRLWNKKWNPSQDMLSTAFIEGVKWIIRESLKEQTESNKPSAEDIAELDKKAFIERAMGHDDIAKAYEACSYSLRRQKDDDGV